MLMEAEFSAALKTAWEDPVVKERCFTTPLATMHARLSRTSGKAEPLAKRTGTSKAKGKGGGKAKGKAGKGVGGKRSALCESMTPEGKRVCYAFHHEGCQKTSACRFEHVCGACFKKGVPMQECKHEGRGGQRHSPHEAEAAGVVSTTSDGTSMGAQSLGTDELPGALPQGIQVLRRFRVLYLFVGCHRRGSLGDHRNTLARQRGVRCSLKEVDILRSRHRHDKVRSSEGHAALRERRPVRCKPAPPPYVPLSREHGGRTAKVRLQSGPRITPEVTRHWGGGDKKRESSWQTSWSTSRATFWKPSSVLQAHGWCCWNIRKTLGAVDARVCRAPSGDGGKSRSFSLFPGVVWGPCASLTGAGII